MEDERDLWPVPKTQRACADREYGAKWEAAKAEIV